VVPGGEVVSISDVRLEGVSSLGTPSRLTTGRTPTPTWTEGTPSYTESTYSGEQAFPATPTSKDSVKEVKEPRVFQETEM
jgi:hypothetical protein